MQRDGFLSRVDLVYMGDSKAADMCAHSDMYKCSWTFALLSLRICIIHTFPVLLRWFALGTFVLFVPECLGRHNLPLTKLAGQ
jgi:hypothetical protein